MVAIGNMARCKAPAAIQGKDVAPSEIARIELGSKNNQRSGLNNLEEAS
jgi:hypothetical protein